MLCKICNKNQATIHIQEIVNGEKKVLHICPECAAKKAKDDPALQGFNIAEMLYNLSSQINAAETGAGEEERDDSDPQEPALSCQGCGWTSKDFRKSGRLGCPECYETFKDFIYPALGNMHRGAIHVGKRPGQQPGSSEPGKNLMEIMRLQKQLEEHIRREEYENAALIRDKISELKNKQSGKN